MAGKAVAQGMKAVDRSLLLAARYLHRWLQPDPADYPENVQADFIASDIFAAGVFLLIASRTVWADIFTEAPPIADLQLES